jgi:hypothetical protein
MSSSGGLIPCLGVYMNFCLKFSMFFFRFVFKFGVRDLHVLLLDICERAEVNRIRKDLSFLEGVNGITFTRAPWSIVDVCVTVLRHGTSETNLILVKEMPFFENILCKSRGGI